MRVLITGASGQLGSELKKIAKDYASLNFVFVNREAMSLEHTEAIISFLNKVQPDIIINVAAYTAVDNAEKEKEIAEKINHYAVDTISKWCTENDAKLVHISTDYVFDGKSKIPYKERHSSDPINWYGETKLRGEQAIKRNGTKAVIIRTSWLYSEYGHNFVKTMLRLMKERDQIGVVNDQIGTPTYALDLAKAIMKIIKADSWTSGVFHYSNEGQISWYNFAVAINKLSGLSCKVNPVTSEQFLTIANRPNYSLLDKTKIKDTYHIIVPNWKDSLEQCLKRLNR